MNQGTNGLAVPDRIFVKHLGELLDTWQAKALRHARGKDAAILLSVLAHNYKDAMETLMKAVFPGFVNVNPPIFVSACKVMRNGTVVADWLNRQHQIVQNVHVANSLVQLQGVFRTMADELKLTDVDRVDMFRALQRWIVADYRKGANGEDLGSK